jgi:hypothetical protein
MTESGRGEREREKERGWEAGRRIRRRGVERVVCESFSFSNDQDDDDDD